tara:strand:- start:139 stop:366 length:228 start_codon:yes stop_codon:yes gene_type:complete
MFLRTLYSISVITGSGFCGGGAFLIFYDIYRRHIMKKHNLVTLNSITSAFNIGFYVGSALGVLYLLNGSEPSLYN